jgi:thioesterase domain-containing protein
LLFVKLKAGVELDDELRMRIARRLRDECSTRHVPDDIHAVPDIPYTLTAKKMEVPVMRILNGAPAAAVADTDAMRNPAAIGWFVEFRAASVRGARVAGTTVEPEAAVASAWRQALGRHSLQSDAPFDELGGDSLRELKLVFHLESELGCKIPLDIFRPSMRRSEFTAALERYLAGGLRRSQTAPTVMLLPGRAGDTPALADFRMSFGSDLNVALLDYPDWTDLVDPVDPFGSFVHAMVERIERAAPVGPLRLAGYSLGGALLYSVARELIARGRRIDALAVIDARFGLTPKLGPADPATKQTLARPVSTHDALPIAFARRVARPFGREILQPVLRALIPLRRVPLPFGLTWYLHAEISDIVRVALVDRWWRALTPPVPPLSTPLTVFCSQERVAGEPADYGWSRACADVTVVDVPGMHESMLDPENRELLCAEFLALMTRPRVPEEALAAAGR